MFWQNQKAPAITGSLLSSLLAGRSFYSSLNMKVTKVHICEGGFSSRKAEAILLLS